MGQRTRYTKVIAAVNTFSTRCVLVLPQDTVSSNGLLLEGTKLLRELLRRHSMTW